MLINSEKFKICRSFLRNKGGDVALITLTLKAPTPQNGQTHSNSCLSVFDHFVGLAFKGLRDNSIERWYNPCTL